MPIENRKRSVWSCMRSKSKPPDYASLSTIFSLGSTTTVVTGEYWQQTPDGTLLIGGCSSVAPNGDPGIWETLPTPDVQAAIEQILLRLFPSLARVWVLRGLVCSRVARDAQTSVEGTEVDAVLMPMHRASCFFRCRQQMSTLCTFHMPFSTALWRRSLLRLSCNMRSEKFG